MKTFINSHILISTVVMLAFVSLFSLPYYVMILHGLLVFCLYSLTLLVIQRCYSRPHVVKKIFFASLSFLIISLYTLNFLSNHFWGSNVSIRFIITYLGQLNSLLEDIPYGVIYLASIFIILWLSCFMLYRLKFAKILTTTTPLKFRDNSFTLLLTTITLVFLYFSFSATNPLFWEGEPITNLALNHTPTNFTAISSLNKNQLPHNNSEQSIKNNIKPNIILIHADALRADHMSAYGYHRTTTPYLDSVIKNDGYKVDMGLSICSESICGMLSALGSAEVNKQHAGLPLLPHILKNDGYKTHLIGTGNFSWEGIDKLLSPSLDIFIRADLETQYSIHDDYAILDALSKLPNNGEQASFFFLRYMSSHQVGKHFNKYAKYSPYSKSLLSYIFPEIEEESAINAYDNSIVQLDDLVKQSIEIMENKGYLENSIIVLYGDHGEAFGEHHYYGHYKSLYQEEIHVPIIFWSSKFYELPKEKFATIMDIAPTILDLAEINIPASFDGLSLLRAPKKRTTFHDSKRGIVAAILNSPDKQYKLMIDKKGKTPELLFNLKDDPKELNPIKKIEDDNIYLELKGKLEKHFHL